MADPDRKPITPELTTEARAGWRTATRVYGGTVTSLAEVIGLELAQLDGPAAKLPRHWRQWFAAAAELEEMRRSGQGRRS